MRSLLWIPALPLLDMASRRAREAALADEACSAGVAAAEVAAVGVACAVLVWPLLAATIVVSPALPLLVMARRLARAISREL
jgi:predicted metal-binding membrane protein